jgi:XTP/dITP diphosphohydrolase
MRSLIFATNNLYKLEEIRKIFIGRIEIFGLGDIGYSGNIPEDQETLEGNAAQKALFIYTIFGKDCFADDTGLEIESLNGEPGVYSARYAGENCSFEDNMNKVLKRMQGKNNRRARFRTVISLVEKGGLRNFEGTIYGNITTEKHGTRGFGYDPVFVPEGYDRTFAEMTLDEKNSISHRARAVEEFSSYLTGINK